jgi:thiol-disulfide isomerase/thioredoxin
LYKNQESIKHQKECLSKINTNKGFKFIKITFLSKSIYYYSAEWCEPCKALGPTMEQIAKQIPVQKRNVYYTDPAIIAEAKVRNVPTVVLMENGIEVFGLFIQEMSYTQIMMS